MANERDQPLVYQIRIEGHLDRRWTDWFGGLSITLEDDGETLLAGPGGGQGARRGPGHPPGRRWGGALGRPGGGSGRAARVAKKDTRSGDALDLCHPRHPP